jgi:hypothetical protein
MQKILSKITGKITGEMKLVSSFILRSFVKSSEVSSWMTSLLDYMWVASTLHAALSKI